MARIRLRPVREADLETLAENNSRDADPWNWFRHTSTESLRRRFAADGLLSDEAGTLAVETPDGALAGTGPRGARSLGGADPGGGGADLVGIYKRGTESQVFLGG
jgi:hypothetical protein